MLRLNKVSVITKKYNKRLPINILLIIFLTILILTSCKKSKPVQPHEILWKKTYGGNSRDYGRTVQLTSDGGYIIAGYTKSFGPGNPFRTNVYLIKTDANGDTIWTKIYGDTADDRAYSVQLTSDGGYIITGFTVSIGANKSDVWLLKTDVDGDTVWTKTYGEEDSDVGLSVQQVSDGGYIIAGQKDVDLYLIKTDSNGDTIWTKTYGGSGWDEANSVYETPDNGYIVAGWTNSFGAGADDIWLLKTDANGDTLWTKTYGGSADEVANSLHLTSDGGYIITGAIYFEPFEPGGDIYFIKTNENGDLQWTKTYHESYYQTSYSVEQTSDGGFIIAGLVESVDSGLNNILLIKIDADGNLLWTDKYGSGEAYSVHQTPDGGYIITGTANDVFLIKTTPDSK